MRWSRRRTSWRLLGRDREQRWRECSCISNRRLRRFLNREGREKLLMLGFKWLRL